MSKIDYEYVKLHEQASNLMSDIAWYATQAHAIFDRLTEEPLCLDSALGPLFDESIEIMCEYQDSHDRAVDHLTKVMKRIVTILQD